jgi:putative membrane protein
MSQRQRRAQIIEIDGPAEPIDHSWEDFVAKPDTHDASIGSGLLIAGGLFILIIGFFVVQAVGWVASLIETRPWLGIAGAFVLGIGLLMLLWAIWRELAALFAVRRMEDWQAALAEDADDMDAARHAANSYIALVRSNGVPIGDAREMVRGANSVSQIRQALEDSVLKTLDARASRTIRAGAAQAFGLSAISPSASIDALLFSFRGIRLVRQIARAYGLRPHALATWALLRRVMSSASLVAVVDVASGMVGHALLTNPLAEKIVGEVAGAAVAYQRMFRLGRISSAACRLIPKAPVQDD